ncbi:MAG: hypothetical protein IPM82_01265 [Saprospiraceae bacterium]|nr:hypothetical protein [Saprospiraceae bacterium]
MAEGHLCITTDASQRIKLDSEVAFGHDKSDKVGRRSFYKKALYSMNQIR